MKKTGPITMAVGATLAAALFAVRQTAWFRQETLRSMSEYAEWINAAFWASLIVVGVGLILLVRSLLTREDAEPVPPLMEEVWICPRCGCENGMENAFCMNCGAAAHSPDPATDGDWTCPWCGRVHAADASVCTACGYDRFSE